MASRLQKLPPRSLGKRWSDDLKATQEGRLSFDKLARRHAGIIRSIAKPWGGRCPANVGSDDLGQEILLEVWQALESWDPERGVPLNAFVRLRIRNRLLAYTHRLVRSTQKDHRFLSQQIIEEKVVAIAGRGARSSTGETTLGYEAVTLPPSEESMDVRALAARVIGGLPSKQARVLVGVLTGETTESVTVRVYGSKCKRPRKAALRALAAAATLVESSGAVPEVVGIERKIHGHQHEEAGEEAHGSTAEQATAVRRQGSRQQTAKQSPKQNAYQGATSYLGQGE